MRVSFGTSTPGPPVNAVRRCAGLYAIPDMDLEGLSVITNKPSTGPYQGAEGAFFMEGAVYLIAQELGLDPVEVRRKNLIPPSAVPYDTATGLTYDSGNYAPALDKAPEPAE